MQPHVTLTNLRHTRLAAHRATNVILSLPVGELILQQITDRRKLAAVHQTFLALGGQTDTHNAGLSCEGFRQALKSGRLGLDDLPRLFEAMALNDVDPLQALGVLESACVPRDPDLDGKISTELAELAQRTGEIAFSYKSNGDSLAGYTNGQLRHVMGICARILAAARRLHRESVEAYAA